MKTEQHDMRRQAPQAAGSPAGRCAPFCGLGAQEFVQRRAALHGALQPERRTPRLGEPTDALTGS